MTLTKKILSTIFTLLAIGGMILMSTPAQAGFFDWFKSTPLNQEAAALRSVSKIDTSKYEVDKTAEEFKYEAEKAAEAQKYEAERIEENPAAVTKFFNTLFSRSSDSINESSYKEVEIKPSITRVSENTPVVLDPDDDGIDPSDLRYVDWGTRRPGTPCHVYTLNDDGTGSFDYTGEILETVGDDGLKKLHCIDGGVAGYVEPVSPTDPIIGNKFDLDFLNKEEIRIAQSVLSTSGFYNGSIDGDFGSRSSSSLVNWQAKNRLSKTGKIDSATKKALNDYLNKNTVLSKIVKNPGVSRVQKSPGGVPVIDPIDDDGIDPSNSLSEISCSLAGPCETLQGLCADWDGEYVQETSSTGFITGTCTYMVLPSTDPDPDTTVNPTVIDRSFSYVTSKIKLGMRGSDVYNLQRILKAKGYYSGPVDSFYGEGTKDGLKEYQQNEPPTQFFVTGATVGKNTLKKLQDTVDELNKNLSRATSVTPYALGQISYWWGKVNLHKEVGGIWTTDSDGVSGANLDKLTYCQKFWPATASYEEGGLETITGWYPRYNLGNPLTSTKMTYNCLTEELSQTPPMSFEWLIVPNTFLSSNSNHLLGKLKITNNSSQDLTFKNSDNNKIVVSLTQTVNDDTDLTPESIRFYDQGGQLLENGIFSSLNGTFDISNTFSLSDISIAANSHEIISIFVDATDSEDMGDSLRLWLNPNLSWNNDTIVYGLDGSGSFVGDSAISNMVDNYSQLHINPF